MVVLGDDGGFDGTAEGTGNLLEEIMRDDVWGHEDDGGRLDGISAAVSEMIAFVESLVEEATSLDNEYKELLGNIFKTIAPDADLPSGGSTTSASDMEERLDSLLSSEKEAFTPGFLRHVEGECDRLSNLEEATPESTRMLQILRVVQARVLEELGQVRVESCPAAERCFVSHPLRHGAHILVAQTIQI